MSEGERERGKKIMKMLVLSSSQLLVIGERQRVRWREDRRRERGSGTCAERAGRRAEWWQETQRSGMVYLRTDCFVVPAKFASVRGSKYDIKFYFRTRKRQLLEFSSIYRYSWSSSSFWTDVDINYIVLTLLPTRQVFKAIIIVLSESFVLGT